MLKNIEIKKEIYVSVIVTILTIIFIDPILKFVWGGMIWFGTTSYQGFLNSMYKGAALGHRNYVDVFIFGECLRKRTDEVDQVKGVFREEALC